MPRTEREKMLAGELYDPFDADLVASRVRARDLCQALNATREREEKARRAREARHPGDPARTVGHAR